MTDEKVYPFPASQNHYLESCGKRALTLGFQQRHQIYLNFDTGVFLLCIPKAL
jgi:hypothetical protein